MRRSLLISPYFPPVGVSGTKRALHLSRHLSQFGWSPTILTGAAVGEPIDESLVECVPAELTISRRYSGRLRPWLQARKDRKRRQKKVSPNGSNSVSKPRTTSLWSRLKPKHIQYWLPFDRYWLDTGAGYQAIKSLIEQHSIEVIHVSADPWAPLVAAERISRQFNIPLVVDFRDPWSVHEGKMALRPKLTQWLLKRFEAKLFKQASAIILNTETARDVYVEAYQGRIPDQRFYAVRNAFDRGLFRSSIEPQPSPESPAIFTALYFGRFRAFVSPEVLFKGFAQFISERNLDPSEARLQVAGGLSDEHQSLADRCGLREYLYLTPPIPFRDCLPTLQAASALILVIEPECFMQIPGKLYDYFAAARPIIALSANQEANRMITEVGMGVAVDHLDFNAIAQSFSDCYDRWREDDQQDAEQRALQVEPYSARTQAGKIADIYNAVCGG